MQKQINTEFKRGRNIVITGANTGIGLALARQLYWQGHNVIFGARNVERNQQAIKSIVEASNTTQLGQRTSGTIQSHVLDLAKRDSIQYFSNFVKNSASQGKQGNSIDILINNAALLGPDTLQCVSDIQLTLLVNYFGHFYLTYLLYPQLVNSSWGRIINICSDAYLKIKQVKQNQQVKAGEYDIKNIWDLSCSNKKYDSMQQYIVSKFLLSSFTHKLQQLATQSHANIKACCIHPGFVNTTFGDHSSLVVGIKKQYGHLMIDTKQGAQNVLRLCHVGFGKLGAAGYYGDNGQLKVISQLAQRQDVCCRIWDISQKLYGINFKNLIQNTNSFAKQNSKKQPKSKIWDLTTAVSSQTTVYPGDPCFKAEPICEIAKGSVAGLCQIRMSNHTGTHVDFPSHLFQNAKSSSDFALQRLIGDGVIFEVPEQYKSISKDFVQKLQMKQNDIVFFHTSNSKIPRTGPYVQDYVYLEPDAAKQLVRKKVKMVGIDYLSIDSYSAHDLPTHKILLGSEVLIVEGLQFRNCALGRCKISVIPIRVENLDGLPARVYAQFQA